MSGIGCPYKQRNIGTYKEYCPVIRKTVEGFVMCECDWESCPEFQEQQTLEEAELREYERQLNANGVYEELEIICPASELLGEEFWANAGEES